MRREGRHDKPGEVAIHRNLVLRKRGHSLAPAEPSHVRRYRASGGLVPRVAGRPVPSPERRITVANNEVYASRRS